MSNPVRRYRDAENTVMQAVTCELQEAGVNIDPGQLSWAVSEVNHRMHSLSLDRQFAEEQAKRQREYDYIAEQAEIEKRDRFSREGDPGSALGWQLEEGD